MNNERGLIFKKFIKSPIIKIIIGSIICILIPVLINKLILENLFEILGLSENLNRAIRVFITTIILMPVLYYYLFSKLEKRKITELKFRSMPILFSFLTAVIIIGSSFILLIFTGFIKASFLQFPQAVTVNLILVMSFVIIEEIFFRGIFYRIIENSWGTKIALISSVLIFSLLHLGNENTTIFSFLSVATGGAVLGIIYTYTKNLLAPIAFHFGWNLLQVLLGFGLSGGDEFSQLYILELKLSGSDILTGGISGIENSVIAILFLLILFIVLYKRSCKFDRIIFMKRKI